MSRVVAGKIFWARPCPRPPIPKTRPRGAKADGLRYEKLVAKAIPEAKHGPWYEFQDINGRGYCQPDLVVVQREGVLVLECKLSNYFEGLQQIERLYKPVLFAAYKRPVYGIVVVKSLRSDIPARIICASLDGARDLLKLTPTGVPVVHWLGRFRAPLSLQEALERKFA